MHARSFGLITLAGLLVGCQASRPQPPTELGFTPTACAADYSFLPNRVDCGTMVVEETRGADNGRRVRFPVAIVRALNHPKADPVIALHGGPGGGAIERLPPRLMARATALTEDRDWIFFDQRGTGLATPRLDCGTLGVSDAGFTDDAQALAVQDCGRRLRAQGIDLSQFNVATIVKDLRDLRAALGIQSYNLFGVSYGSRVALGVMRLDPQELRAVVLDSPWPPEANWTAPQPQLIRRELDQVLALCATDSLCAARHPQLGARFDALLQQWMNSPPSREGHRYSIDEMAAYILEALYDDEATRRLPNTLAQFIAGDLAALDTFLIDRGAMTEGQFLAHLCKEEFVFESSAGIASLSSADPLVLGAARAASRVFAACAGFDVGAPDPLENQPVRSDVPTLLIAAEIDAGCPVELAVAAHRSLPRSQLFTMPNMTHSVASRSPCAKRMVAAFLDQPEATVDGNCIARDRPQFRFLFD